MSYQLTCKSSVISMYIFECRVENSVDPDQLTSQVPADIDLHRFQNRIYMGSAWLELYICNRSQAMFYQPNWMY